MSIVEEISLYSKSKQEKFATEMLFTRLKNALPNVAIAMMSGKRRFSLKFPKATAKTMIIGSV
ncbi:MAG: hypothetical protein WBQ58_04875 [Methanoregula sp.]